MHRYIHNVLVLVSALCVVAAVMQETMFVRRDNAGRPLDDGEEKEVSLCAVQCLENNQCQGFLLNNGTCQELDTADTILCGSNPCYLPITPPAFPRNVSSTLHVTKGVAPGEFAPDAFCEEGSYAAGFRMRAKAFLWESDDTAVSAIMLSCVAVAGLGEVGNVTSHPGWTGEWQEQANCPPDYWITSFALKVEVWGTYDNTGLNHMDVRCRGPGLTGTDLVDVTGIIDEALDLTWGEYGAFSPSCAPGTAVCGLSAKHTAADASDDAGVTDLILICC